MNRMRSGITILLAACCGCSSYGGSTTAASASSTATSGTTLGVAGVVAALAVDYLAHPSGPAPTLESRLLGQSRAIMQMCVAADREIASLPDDRETWSYTRGSCEFSLDFDKGWVSGVQFASAPSACRRALDRCLGH
jgi:hypothetical protein